MPMAYASTVTVTRRGGGRLFRALFNTAAVCFGGALVADIVYDRVPDSTWVTFAVWFVTVGMIIGGVAIALGLVEAMFERRLGEWRGGWPYLLVIGLVMTVSLFNAFVHSRDAFAVMPDGLILSAIAVALLFLLPWLGRRAATVKGSR